MRNSVNNNHQKNPDAADSQTQGSAPIPYSPLPVGFLLFTQIGRVIEGNRYVFTSPAGDHRLFSDQRNLDSTTAVFTNGVEAVSARAARAAEAPAQATAALRCF